MTTTIIFTLIVIIYVLGSTYFQRWFVYTKFSKMKKEWLILAKDLNLETNINDGDSLWKWLCGFQPYIKGKKNGFLLNIYLTKTKGFTPVYFTCEIALKKNNPLIFSILNQDNPISKTNNSINSKNPIFDKSFKVSSNDNTELKKLLSKETLDKIINTFTVNMQGAIYLTTKEIKKHREILDNIATKSLFYDEQSFLMKDKWERLSIQRRIEFLVYFAKIID